MNGSMITDGFRRIQFFHGFRTTADDWQACEEFHREKRRIHNQYLHSAGIIPGCMEEFPVTVDDRGLGVHIGRGYAIDGNGNDIYLTSRCNIDIMPVEIPQKYKVPLTLYIYIKYNEERDDFRANPANPEEEGFAFIRETPVIGVTDTQPDNHNLIELARIEVTTESRLSNAILQGDPKANEIDTRFRIFGGARKESLELFDFDSKPIDGQINVVPELETSVHLESVPFDAKHLHDVHRFYKVNAVPLGNAQITWKIEPAWKNNVVEYRLFFRNLSDKSVKVVYRVFRIHQ